MLHKQTVKGNKTLPDGEVRGFYRQKPNRKLPVIGIKPYLYIYYAGKKFYNKEKAEKKYETAKTRLEKLEADSTTKEKALKKAQKKEKKAKLKVKEGNKAMRVIGEPPAILDTAKIYETANQISLFAKSKGFFRASCAVSMDTSGKKVKVVYTLTEREPFIYRRIFYNIEDDSVKKIIMAHEGKSLLQAGERYDQEIIERERERITLLLKNRGYFKFSKQYIYFIVDTSYGKETVNLEVLIKNTENGMHRVYTIDKVFFNIDKPTDGVETDSTVYKDVLYIDHLDKYSKRMLSGKLRMTPGKKYNVKDTRITQRELSNLDNFRFITINYSEQEDSTAKEGSTGKLNTYINAVSFKKYQLTDEWGVLVSQQLPGPYGTISFTSRNVFRGCENLTFGLRAGVEGVATPSSPDRVYRSTEVGGNVQLVIPNLLFPGGVRYKLNDYLPRTRILSSYSQVIRPEFKKNNLLNSLTYSVQPGLYNRINLDLWNLNLITTTITDTSFSAYLNNLFQNGNNLIYSFGSYAISSISASYVFNNNLLNTNKSSRYLSIRLESGGTTLPLLGISKNYLSLWEEEFGFIYFQFLKANVDFRHYIPTAPKATMAFRVNTGYALPYGNTPDFLPYEKYFFTGGSNSIRAWRPRRLGPGAYTPPRRSNGAFDDKYEQPGEILLEASAEYRFNMVSVVDGALFVDAGNVWNNHSQTGTEGAFNENFYRQIAVGAGFGIRLNFNFLILRCDLGLKMWDPAEEGSERFVGKHLTLRNPLGKPQQAQINIGIGYPF